MSLDLAAGDFSTWLDSIRHAIRSGAVVDVPCGDCTACCTSSQFVHVAPDEAETLAHIPPELLFPAPGRPAGHVVLGYDEKGHCPMLVDGRCSIYEFRPRTCRTYDCRVLPAAGFEDDEDVPLEIGERAVRWRFRYATEAARQEHAAVEAAANFLADHPEALPSDTGRPSLTRLAALAIEIFDLFVDREPDASAVRTALAARLTNY
ncbi:MAG: YkgJ family cysteine cluster protein [Acidimicrobiia bacterium]|nr:YkgJ family cysteine cluster protein [Acidimicrobiia bacterium]